MQLHPIVEGRKQGHKVVRGPWAPPPAEGFKERTKVSGERPIGKILRHPTNPPSHSHGAFNDPFVLGIVALDLLPHMCTHNMKYVLFHLSSCASCMSRCLVLNAKSVWTRHIAMNEENSGGGCPPPVTACDRLRPLKKIFVHVYGWHNPYTPSPTPSSPPDLPPSVPPSVQIWSFSPHRPTSKFRHQTFPLLSDNKAARLQDVLGLLFLPLAFFLLLLSLVLNTLLGSHGIQIPE